MNEYIAVGVALAGVVVLWAAYALVLAGSFRRYFASRSLANRWLRDAKYAEKVNKVMEAEKPVPPPPPPKPSAEPLWLLALLQREARLLDFLLEDLSQVTNEQIGAGVRDIHRNSQKVLKEHLVLQPVMPQQENDNVEVAKGFDPSAIRLTGNVTGEAPFHGVLRHHGWRVKELKLAKPPEGQDQFVVQPAEVEMM